MQITFTLDVQESNHADCLPDNLDINIDADVIKSVAETKCHRIILDGADKLLA